MAVEQARQPVTRNRALSLPPGFFEGQRNMTMTEADKAWTPPSLSMTLDVAAGHMKYMANPAQAGRGTRSNINGTFDIGMRTALQHVLISLGSTGEPISEEVATMREVAGVPRIVDSEALYDIWSNEVHAANNPKPRSGTDLSVRVPIDTARAIEDELRKTLARGSNSLTAHFKAALDLAVAVDEARGGPIRRSIEKSEDEQTAQDGESAHLGGQTVYSMDINTH